MFAAKNELLLSVVKKANNNDTRCCTC